MARSIRHADFGRQSGISRMVLIVAAVAVIAIVGAGVVVGLYGGKLGGPSTTNQSSSQQITLNGAGSSLVYPLMSAWIYNYTILNPNVRINYASIGSGAGITQLEAKLVDYGASDAPLNANQYQALTGGNVQLGGVLQIPEVAGALVPAYNLPGIGTGLRFNGTVLADIYLGTITHWNDPALQQLNPGVQLPNNTIFVVHRSDGSGSTFVFTDFLSQVSPAWNRTGARSTSINWPVVLGVGAKGSEGVNGVILGNPYSIGYTESAYATIDHLTYGAVENAAGNYILENATNAAEAVAAAASVPLPQGQQSWVNVSIVDRVAHNTTAVDAYPMTTFTYVMVYPVQTDQVKGQALAKFLWWLINDGQPAVRSLGYVPLPQSVVAIDDATIKLLTYNGQPLLTTTT